MMGMMFLVMDVTTRAISKSVTFALTNQERPAKAVQDLVTVQSTLVEKGRSLLVRFVLEDLVIQTHKLVPNVITVVWLTSALMEPTELELRAMVKIQQTCKPATIA